MNRSARPFWYVAIAVGVAGLILLTAWIMAASIDIQRGNREILDKIKSCTDPRGDCYRDGQKRSGEAIATINEWAATSAACAVGYADEPDVQKRIEMTKRCVIRALDKKP